MKKDIYKIENKINHKIYIGQSINVKDRWTSHCAPSASKKNSLVDRAIGKYGKEYFDFSIIEKDIENYDERERFWIQKYNCLYPNGYNILNGGQSGHNGLRGEKNPTSIYSDKQIKKVQNLLKNTKLNYKEICKITGIQTETTIGYINSGKQWYDENIHYPIRPANDIESKVDEVIYYLKNRYSQREIEKIVGIGHSTVDKINKGLLYPRESENYPIRCPKDVFTSHNYYIRNKAIAKDIKNTNLSFKELSAKYDCNLCIIYGINSGNPKFEEYLYPIRSVQKQNKRKRLTSEQIEYVIKLLKNSKYSRKNIIKILEEKEIVMTTEKLSRINTGKIYHRKNITYPIRGQYE